MRHELQRAVLVAAAAAQLPVAAAAQVEIRAQQDLTPTVMLHPNLQQAAACRQSNCSQINSHVFDLSTPAGGAPSSHRLVVAPVQHAALG